MNKVNFGLEKQNLSSKISFNKVKSEILNFFFLSSSTFLG
jgi:hypothetical protein